MNSSINPFTRGDHGFDIQRMARALATPTQGTRAGQDNEP